MAILRSFANKCAFALLMFSAFGFAQSRPGGGARPPVSSGPTSTSSPNIPDVSNAVFVRGKVRLADGTSLQEPIAINRVCNGAIRREGFTDFKGNFDFQLGQQAEGRDASESGRDVFQNSGNRGPTLGADTDYGVTPTPTASDARTTHPELLGCELRASLPGFTSTSVAIRINGSSFDLDVGTIVLSRMEKVGGTTISLTTMKAPESVRKAYEKAEKAVNEKKFSSAQSTLDKAVQAYPQFAEAWFLLGEVQRQQNNFASAKESYKKAISADPAYVNPYFGLTVLAVHEQNWEDTLNYTTQIEKLNAAAFPLSRMYNAAANFNLGKFDAAEASAKQFISVDQEHHYPEALLLMCNILTSKGDYAGAANALQSYLTVVPNPPNMPVLKARLKELKENQVANRH